MTTAGGSQQRVVVGVDGSAESVAALSWAAKYASATGSHLVAVLSWHYGSAYGPPVGRAPEAITEEVRQHMRDTLGKAIAEAAGDVPVDQQLRYGHPAEVLVEESGQADLLVVGHRGHGAFSGMLVGSVSMHLVSHAHCPVVVVRHQP